MEKQQAAERDYILGMKYKEIAEKYGVSINTVKSWKQRYGWQKGAKKVHTKSQKGCTQKKDALVQEKTDETSQKKMDNEPLPENGTLNDRQKIFCVYYVRSFNATKAYQKAYGCSYEAAASSASEFLKNPKIQEEIKRLKQNRLNKELLSEEDIFQRYVDIAFADITDYVEFGPQGLCFKKSDSVDGTLISEIKDGKAGASIKLADKMQALKWLSDYIKREKESETTGNGQLSELLKAMIDNE